MFRVSSSSFASSLVKNSQQQLRSSLIPISTRSFTVLTEEQAKKDDKHLPVFMVGYKNGFLPRQVNNYKILFLLSNSRLLLFSLLFFFLINFFFFFVVYLTTLPFFGILYICISAYLIIHP